MKEQRYLYVVFSSTPYKMGRFLRIVTHGIYNHVAVSLDSELNTLYSFARRYRNTPFFGGFVRETPMRYRYHGRVARVQVCALPISEEQHREIREHLLAMEEEAEKYLYNLISALCALLHLRVRIRDAYTCVEFAADLLSRFGVCRELKPKRFYTVKKLADALKTQTVYIGPFPATGGKGDPFDEEKRLFAATKLTLVSSAELALRLFHRP